MLDITGISKAVLLTGLYKFSIVQGAGVFEQIHLGMFGRPCLFLPEAEAILQTISAENNEKLYIETLFGKNIFADITNDCFDEEAYDINNGFGTAAIVVAIAKQNPSFFQESIPKKIWLRQLCNAYNHLLDRSNTDNLDDEILLRMIRENRSGWNYMLVGNTSHSYVTGLYYGRYTEDLLQHFQIPFDRNDSLANELAFKNATFFSNPCFVEVKSFNEVRFETYSYLCEQLLSTKTPSEMPQKLLDFLKSEYVTRNKGKYPSTYFTERVQIWFHIPLYVHKQRVIQDLTNLQEIDEFLSEFEQISQAPAHIPTRSRPNPLEMVTISLQKNGVTLNQNLNLVKFGSFAFFSTAIDPIGNVTESDAHSASASESHNPSTSNPRNNDSKPPQTYLGLRRGFLSSSTPTKTQPPATTPYESPKPSRS